MNEVVKFLNDLKRMCGLLCKQCDECGVYPLNEINDCNCWEHPGHSDNSFTRYPQEVYEIVTEWAKKNPEVVVKENDLIVLRYFKLCGGKYVARDEIGLWAYKDKPVKRKVAWTGDSCASAQRAAKHLSFIIWEQEEPWLIDDLIKLGEGKADGEIN